MSQQQRLAWLSRELCLEHRRKRKVCDVWKEGQATPEDCMDIVKLCRAKAQLKLNVVTAVKDN